LEEEMARERDFDVKAAVAQLNKILEMELATVVYYTHYAFMIYGHARIPIRSWFHEQATESLTHAQEAGDLIVHLGHRPTMGIASLPTTHHNTIDEILTEAVEREEDGVQLYRDLLDLIKDKSTVLEEYATRMVATEAMHVSEMQLMLMKSAPQ
jgi:bacterioferritin